ncbi:MAG: hypothetical protein LBH10_04365, partial [Burkholderiaceae bacterium]|nr:hypothetical protein [Burkholderiaceae bacterium]
MNRRPTPTPVTARALAAALLLVALWPVGSRAADAARQASAALPVASAPQADAIPALFRGKWTPISRDFEMLGPLTLGARTLRWSICGKAARRIKQVTDGRQQTDYPAFHPFFAPQVTDHMPQALIDLTADGAPPCHLDGQPVTHLRLKLGSLINPGDVCAMQVTFYGYGPHGPQDGPKSPDWATFTDKRF